MIDFGFGAPWLLAGLILPLVAIVAVWHSTRRGRMTAQLLGGPQRIRGSRNARIRLTLRSAVVAAMVLLVIAAAQPQWGTSEPAVTRRGIDLAVVLDVSRSMLADDVPPTRAGAAAEGLSDLLSHLSGNRVGLVVYAGSALTRAPLTYDVDVVSSLIARAQNESLLVRPGSDFRAAILEAVEVLDIEDPAASQAIILVSDGEDFDSGAIEAAESAAREGINVYTVLVATAAPTPLPPENGSVDVTTGNPDLMAQIAAVGGGTTRESRGIAGLAVDFRRMQQTTFEETPQTALQDQFAWFIGGALLLLLAVGIAGEGGSARAPRLHRGVITSTMALTLAFIVAGCGSAAWQHVERGNEAYTRGEWEISIEAYRAALELLPEDGKVAYNIANVLHEQGLYAEAVREADQARSFALDAEDGATAARALFTVGNSAFLQSDFVTARDAYMAALRLDPTDIDAKANLELLLSAAATQPEPEPAATGGEGGEPDVDAASQETGSGEGEPGEADSEPEDADAAGAEQPSDAQTPSDAGPSQPAPASEFMTPGDARSALAEALGDLGEEITAAEAQRLLELAQRANELEGLPRRAGDTPTPR